MKVTQGNARRFLVARQLLAPARSIVGGPDAVLEVLRRLGSIQFDQIEVPGRSHDLVLHARVVADYDPAWCDVFDFGYVWELYVPPHKRRWGWYVLPIVFRDRLVGRIEPRIDAAEGAVQVLAAWWEDGFEPRRAEGFVDAMREALGAYLRFAKANRLDWPSELGIEKQLFGTASLTASE